MRDAGPRDQLCVHTGILKFGNSRLRRVKRCDMVVAGMNRQNRKPPPCGGCRRLPATGNRRAEPSGNFLQNARSLHRPMLYPVTATFLSSIE